MPHWLASPGDTKQFTHIKRFDPRFWTVNFPRPMMASVVTSGPQSLRVNAVFYMADDLAGLIWESEDLWDHPLVAYETARDYRGCTLGFRWRSDGIMPLDALHGPTLTIEGRDEAGEPRSWYVRLWNYANGTPEDAEIALDFDALEGGFLLPGEADPVWAGDIDRLFLSLVPPGYTAATVPLAAPADAWAELTDISCTGAGSTIRIGDTLLPEHGMRIATGYDDAYNQTPARLVRNALHLGYRDVINHYVGMSHYYRLEYYGWAGGLYISLSGGVLNAPCAAWHADFAARANAFGYALICSLSYELFDAICFGDWKQRDELGNPALTGWEPPSTLLSPASSGAMNFLKVVAQAFVAILQGAGQPVHFQIGEPWWWITQDGNARICLYDSAAQAAFGSNLVSIPTIKGTKTAAEITMLNQAGQMLADSTADVVAAVKAQAADAVTYLLVYLPTVLDEDAPEAKRANVPLGWADPAFDILQLEDYDWVTGGNRGATARAVAAMQARLGYPAERQHYFAGFVLNAEDAAQWTLIDAAAEAGRERGVAETFFWALPQVTRDGFTHFDSKEGDVQAFDDVQFPLALGREAVATPGFSTAIVTTASGAEHRNSDWTDARMRYDAGPGVRSEADVGTLIAFFRARRGAARGFRFHDPFDHSSSTMTGTPEPDDQRLGTGDGETTLFPLVKRYGDTPDQQVRRIRHPVPGTVRVSVDDVEQASGWIVENGAIQFDIPPAADADICAGYLFDVPVRFAEDRLEVSRTTFLAGEAVSVPLIEIRD
ncbi:DUF2460 domain-containing protein [Parasphingopyxis lamellibrachiae]|uniref:Uncharacterized protein (TIGR02217 family) n=1 Tax=Parasphingopyxis lamellibrachiae TaxID=680125 RepID=A0A3D9FE21_9SPHN|nr:DUF2460 domain-containing protein [Parasphingopyxis lamellibrachiae]RED16039.1 uncharacterized protein (TIGR02217 family) [Parasphingopyxis lamellibrachiae]